MREGKGRRRGGEVEGRGGEWSGGEVEGGGGGSGGSGGGRRRWTFPSLERLDESFHLPLQLLITQLPLKIIQKPCMRYRGGGLGD